MGDGSTVYITSHGEFAKFASVFKDIPANEYDEIIDKILNTRVSENNSSIATSENYETISSTKLPIDCSCNIIGVTGKAKIEYRKTMISGRNYLDFQLATYLGYGINQYKNEKIYIISLSCNDMNLEVCINKNDLIGEPAVARRFKGEIWMQGNIVFS